MNFRTATFLSVMIWLPGTHLLGSEQNKEQTDTQKVIAVFNQGYAPSTHDENRIRAILTKLGVNHLVREIKISNRTDVIKDYDMKIIVTKGTYNLLIEQKFLDTSRNDDEFAFCIGHEAGHIAHNHLIQHNTAHLPETQRPRADRIQEYEADTFSARELKVAQAAINFFSRFVPHMPHPSTALTSYDGHVPGDNLHDSYPSFSTRIRYLMPIAAAQA